MKKPVVALVGSPNVGKSTLFNKMAGRKISIIEDTPGVTRDRIYANVKYNEYTFHLIDTGGVDIEKSQFNSEIKYQVELAIDEADVIIFVVDGKLGLTSNDYIVKEMLLKTNKKVIVAINKVDTKESKQNLYDFYELGFEIYIQTSGEQKVGIYDLLDEVTKDFVEYKEEYDEDTIKFCAIGRPNVGKSSLVNAIINEEKLLVSDIPGTTRDSTDTPFIYHEKSFVAIDTAGMRKKGKVYEKIEKYSLLRSMKSIDRSDVCLLVLNVEEGIIEHDKHIASYALDAGKAIVIVVNKWDTIESKEEEMKTFRKLIEAEFAFLSYVPVVFLSAKTKKRLHTLLPEVMRVSENSKKSIKTSILNKVLMEAYTLNIPPSYKGKRLKIYFSVQVSTQPPVFNIQVNSKGLIHFSYERYLENKLRESFDFTGVPIKIQFKNKGEKEI